MPYEKILAHGAWINTYKTLGEVPITPSIQMGLNVQSKFLDTSKKIIDTTEHFIERTTGTQI